MELSEYLIKRKELESGFTQRQFAKEIGIAIATMTRICRGRTIPSGKLALKIENATKGKVSGWQLILRAINNKEEKKQQQHKGDQP